MDREAALAAYKTQDFEKRTLPLWNFYLEMEFDENKVQSLMNAEKRSNALSDLDFRQNVIDIINNAPAFTDDEKQRMKKKIGIEEPLPIRHETEYERTLREIKTSFERRDLLNKMTSGQRILVRIPDNETPEERMIREMKEGRSRNRGYDR